MAPEARLLCVSITQRSLGHLGTSSSRAGSTTTEVPSQQLGLAEESYIDSRELSLSVPGEYQERSEWPLREGG